MISVEEGLAYINEHQRDFGTETVPLSEAMGRILAESVFADRDFPPYDRVTMDGIAINARSFKDGYCNFRIEKVQGAGQPQQQLEDEHQCIEVMTGAILPDGTDAVIPYEDCAIADGIARITVPSINTSQNIHRQGTDGRQGELVISKGYRITAAKVGILATVGHHKVIVERLPRVAICSTGDELVEVTSPPKIHQIRQSNSYMLAAAMLEEGIIARTYHLPDDRDYMRQQLETILINYDVLLFSGAVSRGKYDYLPEVLQELGMKTIFHRVAQRPGKPLLFGKFTGGPIVFGFPGNPVSTMVSYKVFFQHWLHQSLSYQPPAVSAKLAVDVHFKPALTYHLLVTTSTANGVIEATPCAGANSGDMLSLERADGILSLPFGKDFFERGEAYPLILLV